MTKQLEEIFNVEPEPVKDFFTATDDEPEDLLKDDAEIAVIPGNISENTLIQIEKINSALPSVRELESSDKEMDDLAAAAVDSFNELMTLGMNVDSRTASEIFGVASGLLGHAITAKNAKVNKKLRMVDLQIKQLRLQHDIDKHAVKQAPLGDNAENGEGHIIDRNELLRQLLDKAVDADTATKE